MREELVGSEEMVRMQQQAEEDVVVVLMGAWLCMRGGEGGRW